MRPGRRSARTLSSTGTDTAIQSVRVPCERAEGRGAAFRRITISAPSISAPSCRSDSDRAFPTSATDRPSSSASSALLPRLTPSATENSKGSGVPAGGRAMLTLSGLWARAAK